MVFFVFLACLNVSYFKFWKPILKNKIPKKNIIWKIKVKYVEFHLGSNHPISYSSKNRKVNEKNSTVFSDTKFGGKINEGSRLDIKVERFMYSKSYSHITCSSEIFKKLPCSPYHCSLIGKYGRGLQNK